MRRACAQTSRDPSRVVPAGASLPRPRLGLDTYLYLALRACFLDFARGGRQEKSTTSAAVAIVAKKKSTLYARATGPRRAAAADGKRQKSGEGERSVLYSSVSQSCLPEPPALHTAHAARTNTLLIPSLTSHQPCPPSASAHPISVAQWSSPQDAGPVGLLAAPGTRGNRRAAAAVTVPAQVLSFPFSSCLHLGRGGRGRSHAVHLHP